MKERPILFSTPMVKAILDGRKTMTRRVIKPQFGVFHDLYLDGSIETERIYGKGDGRIHCPYGQVGDRLWCKETYSLTDLGVIYKANMDDADMRLFGSTNRKWKPSIFMPRKFSRITLAITNIRVERLQDICLADIQAEGIYDDRRTHNAPLQIGKFKSLWNSINSDRGYSWEANPWVWVIEFVREVGQ